MQNNTAKRNATEKTIYCRGTEMLRQAVQKWKPVRVTHEEAAERLGIATVSFWCIYNGFNRPSLETAVAIKRVFGVPVEAWVDQPEDEDNF